MFTVSSFSNPNVHALQTTRKGGFSQTPFDSMNLGENTGDEAVEQNIRQLTKTAKLPHSPLFLNQIHSSSVVEYSAKPQTKQDADACFTRASGVVCAVLTADCLPILLSSKSENLVAAIHCGWRGLHQDILAKTIAKMQTKTVDLEAWLGPSISYKAYEVGEDFRENFVSANAELAHAFYRDKRQKWHADLKKIAQIQLQNLGVQQITQSPFCTFENNSLFFSYRKNQKTGRMASMIWIEP